MRKKELRKKLKDATKRLKQVLRGAAVENRESSDDLRGGCYRVRTTSESASPVHYRVTFLGDDGTPLNPQPTEGPGAPAEEAVEKYCHDCEKVKADSRALVMKLQSVIDDQKCVMDDQTMRYQHLCSELEVARKEIKNQSNLKSQETAEITQLQIRFDEDREKSQKTITHLQGTVDEQRKTIKRLREDIDRLRNEQVPF